MSASEITNQLQRLLPALRREYDLESLSVFGSYVRDEQRPDSDLDLLVDLDENHSLLDRIAITQELEEYLGCKVDVLSPRALHKLIRDEILHEAVSL